MRALIWSGALMLVGAALLAAPSARLPDHPMTPHHGMFMPGQIRWGPPPPTMPPGSKVAVLEGDPSKPGPFTMRLWMPSGYKIPPHWHPGIEHVTVLSGTYHLAMGAQFDDRRGQAFGPGSFVFMAPHMQHYVWATGETVIQSHGMGPMGIVYVNPGDDPRKTRKPS